MYALTHTTAAGDVKLFDLHELTSNEGGEMFIEGGIYRGYSKPAQALRAVQRHILRQELQVKPGLPDCTPDTCSMDLTDTGRSVVATTLCICILSISHCSYLYIYIYTYAYGICTVHVCVRIMLCLR
jgi:hypothetical protein